MFKRNQCHLQPPLISNINDLPEKHRKRLETSWAGVFYRDMFCRIDEAPFAVLYVDYPSRPNEPVNVLVGLEWMKAGFGWSDEELYDEFTYNMQVRYALGYHELGEGDFDLRTLYYFRARLGRCMQETGVNLVEQAFEQVTDKQLQALALKTGKQRMDSTQVASNIRQMSRLQLVVEVLQRVERMLNDADRERYTADFAPYVRGHSGQYVYRVKGADIPTHLEQIGRLMQRLVDELRVGYAEQPAYRVLERVFGEHFRVVEGGVQAKAGTELSAQSLQSPDDWEATYREKNGQGYQGYVANLTETCDPENPLQLITKVQTAANSTDDSQLLAEAVPNLKERMELDKLYTDGGHGGPQADTVLHEQQVEHVQTAIRGRIPDPDKLHLSDFNVHFSESGQPTQITCPHGQQVSVQPTHQRKGFVARFAPAVCQTCPFAQKGSGNKCPAQLGKRDGHYRLAFTQTEAQAAQRRRRSLAQQKEGRNLRAAVESTVRSVKHPFPASKLPVRGRFRMACLLIGSAAMTNVRRIQRYWQAKNEAEKQTMADQNGQKGVWTARRVSFFAVAKAFLRRWLMPTGSLKPCLGC